MRKLLSFHLISLDGYYEGPGQAFDWPVVDAEFNQFAARQQGAASQPATVRQHQDRAALAAAGRPCRHC